MTTTQPTTKSICDYRVGERVRTPDGAGTVWQAADAWTRVVVVQLDAPPYWSNGLELFGEGDIEEAHA